MEENPKEPMTRAEVRQAVREQFEKLPRATRLIYWFCFWFTLTTFSQTIADLNVDLGYGQLGILAVASVTGLIVALVEDWQLRRRRSKSK